MTINVNCPSPKCRYHKRAFSVEATSPIAKKGGNARWKKMTPKERKQHIARMMKARRKNLSKKK